MDTTILACGSLADYVNAAQAKLKTCYPVTYLNKEFHKDPKLMKEHIIQTVNKMPDSFETVLVAMGFCGGSWEGQSFNKRVVIPKVDDCVSLLLHKNDRYCPNLKQKGHLYMKDKNPYGFSMEKAFNKYTEGMDGDTKAKIRKAWVDSYTCVDIVDTGLYDCHSDEYAAEAMRNADWIEGKVEFVKGSNRIIEKLISGKWDAQFFVAEPGHVICHEDIFE